MSLDDQKLAVCCNRCTGMYDTNNNISQSLSSPPPPPPPLVCESELARCPTNSSCVPNGVDYSCECNKGFVMTNSNTSCIGMCTMTSHDVTSVDDVMLLQISMSALLGPTIVLLMQLVKILSDLLTASVQKVILCLKRTMKRCNALVSIVLL